MVVCSFVCLFGQWAFGVMVVQHARRFTGRQILDIATITAINAIVIAITIIIATSVLLCIYMHICRWDMRLKFVRQLSWPDAGIESLGLITEPITISIVCGPGTL